MDQFRERRAPDEEVTMTLIREKGKRDRLYIAIGVIVVVLLFIAALALTFFNKSRELNSQLKAATEELKRQQQLAADLEEHSRGLEAENSTLTDQINEFLNVQEAEPVITSKQIQEQLSALSELVTQAYMYTNAEKEEEPKTWLKDWPMPFSEKSFIVKYDGTIKAGISFSAIKIDVNEDARRITVTLPPSKIIDHNVPQDKIEIFGVRDGLFNEVDPNDPNELIAKGKEMMEEKAVERGFLTEADQEAATLIRAFLSLLPGMDTYELIIK